MVAARVGETAALPAIDAAVARHGVNAAVSAAPGAAIGPEA
jgi:hypothetical protein